MSWRDTSRPIIAQVLAETVGLPEKEIRKQLRDAYPFGMRKYHPYKIWLDEISRQRNPKKHEEPSESPNLPLFPVISMI